MYVKTNDVPSAFVTKGKKRLRQYDGYVYLNHGDEFELELFNPTSQKILAKISLNGEDLGSGIILRPGERVFLERYFDEARKFLFETYEIDKNDEEAKRAIEKNGLVEVSFYKERKMAPTIISFTYDNTNVQYQPKTNFHTRLNPDASYIGTTATPCSMYSSNIDMSCSAEQNTVNYSHTNDKMETGRIERGNQSNQEFIVSDDSFDYFYSWKKVWKILSESSRPVFKEDLKEYCTNCGARRKKSSHKFCPHCGNKF